MYCGFCDNEAEYMIEGTEAPLCPHCQEMYELGKEGQGTIVLIEDYEPPTECDKGYKVNDPDADLNGTSLVGSIDISFYDIMEKLGESSEDYDDGKSDAEWTILFADGSVATIYNYKDGRNYNGAEGLETDEITDWHIGGKDKSVVAKVYCILGRGIA
jgi:hypothetical protein